MFQAGGFPTLGRVIADWMPITERGSAQGSIWMFSRWGGALIPFLLIWLFRVWGSWPIPVLADRRARPALVRRILAVVPRPPRGDAAGQSRRAENHRGRAERRFSMRPTRVPWREDARLEERLVVVPDVRLHRLLGQLLHDHAASVPDQAAAPFRRRDRLALGAAAGRRLDRLHPGRHRVGLGDPPLRQPQVGAPLRRAGGTGPGRPGLAGRQLGRERLAARRAA